MDNKPPLGRSLSPVPNQFRRPVINAPEIIMNNSVYLISFKLWEAATGEKIFSEDSFAPKLDTPLIPDNNFVSPQQQQQRSYVMQARDPMKSRSLQKKMTECSKQELDIIFNSLYPSLNELVFDQSANFVIQKLCETATEEQQQKFLKFFLSDLNNIVDHSIACRVLQRFIETTQKENIEKLFNALKPNLMSLCLSQNGNHIVQRFVMSLPSKLNVIIDAILPSVVPLAIDNCGCRIVQRLFDQYKIEQLESIVAEVMRNAVELATNQYGNYVVQYILASNKHEHISNLLKAFKGRFYQFSLHKFASNVIEKCIRGASEEERMEIFPEIIGSAPDFNATRISTMVEDQFGNYVIQRIIEFGTEEQQTAIYNVVFDNYQKLEGIQYSKHVLLKLQHLGYKF
ncbi:Pumilio-family RNA binding repeat containing protein [Trichomonas vaginalis G3]|uniref:Pumilio-family RNA binding repeat containing protein n=1 Tax=Trichomonas vaginalis (strain ATCC PRA-98 / G3) TaxID=412133 RepID=A2FHX8_TRIV3|nr:mRNA binding [Trichomonas vaginalis G3]EAX95487.1 Pumilio-family RNA binding repeat containing protein [Trichomonas vaginalis G3]KAI5531080.1 mRNA binding [Trichomonas vaginalis G3]|eukprot:XP_001308417.1 Pumilio-family RNA binding repeat containing protein [Trichomonas vaginalis G3]